MKLNRRIRKKLEIVLGGGLIRLIYFTNRYRVEGKHHIEEALASGKSVILAIWHGRLLTLFIYLAHRGFYALAGMHKDAELITQIGVKIGWRFIRGSSTRHGREAFQEMVELLKQPGVLVFITPDGPKGPARIPKAGALRAAQKTGALLVPASCQSTRYWGFTNWDTFMVSKPFARTEIMFGPPLEFDGDADFDAGLVKFKNALDELSREVDARTDN